MAFQQGLSGLNTSSKALDVISNNVANASTVGFKAGNTVFADVYASALSGAVSNIQIGIGSSVIAVRQAFTQGNLATSANALDMAINGNGFFRMELNDGTIGYTRNGQFDVDKDGYIVDSLGDKLTGFEVLSTSSATSSVFAGVPSVLKIDTSNIAPNATQGVDGVTLYANLDSRDVNPTVDTPPGPAFDPLADPIPADSYNSTTSLTVYDSLGNAHSLSLYYIRNDPATDNTWTVYGSLDGDTPTLLTGALEFDEYGAIVDPVASVLPFSRTAAELANGAADLSFSIDVSGSTQYGSPFGVNELSQNGYSTGQLAGITVTDDGIIQGRYSNGQSRDIGRLALANFASPNGLISLGNNLWAESPASGQPIVGAPGTGVLGVVSAGMVEESNVDLTAELVNMIVQQRNYQANAQSIRTQDQVMQTIVNLR